MPGPSARARVRLTPPLARHKAPESAKSRRPEGPQDLTKRLSHVARRPVKSEVNRRHAAADVLMKGPEEPKRIPDGDTGRHHPERLRNVVVGRVGAQADDRAGLARDAGPSRQPTYRRCPAFDHPSRRLDGCRVDRERHTRDLDHWSAPSAARDRVRRPRAPERPRGCRRQGRSRHPCHALQSDGAVALATGTELEGDVLRAGTASGGKLRPHRARLLRDVEARATARTGVPLHHRPRAPLAPSPKTSLALAHRCRPR